jgi:protein TonB
MHAIRAISSTSERSLLPLTLSSAAALHAALIMFTGFDFELADSKPDALPTLEITLLHHSTSEVPEKADKLAQVSHQGGGKQESTRRARSPASRPREAPDSGLTHQTREAAAPRARPPERPAKLTTRSTTPVQTAADTQAPTETKPRPLPDARALISRSLELARLSSEIAETVETTAEKPRHKYLGARTQAYKYALYMEAWRSKVEHIGDLNYPVGARGRKLAGDLRLDVALKADGDVHAINLLRSSGNEQLDRSAIEIVRLAAPFAPFPDDVREETDILHIVRTWQFHRDRNQLGK